MPETAIIDAPKIGRPSIRNPEMEARLFDALAGGAFLQDACKADGMPSWRAVYDWAESDPVFAQSLARARRVGAEGLVAEGLRILDNADDSEAPPITKAVGQANYRKWLAGCLDRDTYGDRTQVALSGSVAALVAFVGSTPRPEDAQRVIDAIPHAVVPDGSKDAPG